PCSGAVPWRLLFGIVILSRTIQGREAYMPIPPHLNENLAHQYWNDLVHQQGIAGLLGPHARDMVVRFRDSVPFSWMENMSAKYGVQMDTRQHFDMLVMAWMVARATD